jgi:flagellar basal-body rod protein FlgB
MTAPISDFDMLSRLLDVAEMRHRVIAQNVANVNTPGYRKLDLSFENAFAKQLSHGGVAASLEVKPKLIEASGGRERADGNNVDIDVEMGRLNKNALLYSTYTQLLASQIGSMKAAITGH